MDALIAEYEAPLQIYEQLAEKIRSEILFGKFGPETRLPAERELARRFGVGRPAVREAIVSLQNEGLVATKRGSGTYVTANALTILNAEHTEVAISRDFSPTATLDVRMVLEPAIARLAAKHAKRDPEAEKLLDAMTGVVDIDDPVQTELWSHCDRMFHRQLAVMTGDLLLIKIADEVAASMGQPLWKNLRDEGIYSPDRIQLYVAEHRLIYEAIVEGDGDVAAFYIEQHIKRVRREIAPE